jgi:hypothetical protein
VNFIIIIIIILVDRVLVLSRVDGEAKANPGPNQAQSTCLSTQVHNWAFKPTVVKLISN